jgi:hypothetical protein
MIGGAAAHAALVTALLVFALLVLAIALRSRQ